MARIEELEAYLERSARMLNVRRACLSVRPAAAWLILYCDCRQWIIEHSFANLLIGGSYPRSFVSLRLLGLVVASSACVEFPTYAADVQSLPGLKASETVLSGKAAAQNVIWPTRVTLFAVNDVGRQRVRKVLRCLRSTFTDVRTCALALCVRASICTRSRPAADPAVSHGPPGSSRQSLAYPV